MKPMDLKRVSSLAMVSVLTIFLFTSCITSLMKASYYGRTEDVKKLVAEGADVNKGNPLFQAVFKNNIEIVKILINKGADVNRGSQKGKTNEWKPIHIAAKYGYVEMVKLLIDKGADLNVVSPLGQTPLAIAEEKGLSVIVRIIKATDEQKYNNLLANNEIKKESVTEHITDVKSDVDVDIPLNKDSMPNSYALIIGNEDYSSFQKGLSTEVNVDFAINDAKVFTDYCIKTIGIPERQIKTLTNATVGQINEGIIWISNLAKVDDGKAELIFYYSGHGLPDEKNREPYLIPVDVSGNNITLGIKLSDVYEKLTEYPSKKVLVFLDACFSGGARNQGLISMKGVKVKPKMGVVNGNMIVFASSTGEESSGVYREKQHGFMTYFLLKKLKETKGEVTLKDLSDFVVESVSKETALKGKVQTPQVNFSPDIEDKWFIWRVK